MKITTLRRTVLASAAAAGVATALLPLLSGSGQSRKSGALEVDGEGADIAASAPARPARLVTHEVESGGRPRTYAVYAPRRRDGARPMPAVLDIHGTGSHPAQELSIDGLAAAAEERGFVVLLPVAVVPHPAGGSTWNVPPDPQLPDDERYLLDLLEDASRRHELDPSRVYVTGFSGGARLGSGFASRHADRVRALAVVGGLRASAGDGPPVPVLAFHGTGDPINPYAGGGPRYWGYGVERALTSWVERNRCREEHVEANVAPSVWKRKWSSCDGVTEVTLYRFDGGHVWPGSSFAFPVERFGPMPHGIDATTLVLDFFERHGLPAASPTEPGERHRARSSAHASRGVTSGSRSPEPAIVEPSGSTHLPPAPRAARPERVEVGSLPHLAQQLGFENGRVLVDARRETRPRRPPGEVPGPTDRPEEGRISRLAPGAVLHLAHVPILVDRHQSSSKPKRSLRRSASP
jgi:polyhydroxybutyrate depolymerase